MSVHEISGVVPDEVIDMLLNAVGVDRAEGVSQALWKGGFEVVRAAIKKVGREGWSAGQVLEQVSYVELSCMGYTHTTLDGS